MKIATWNVNSLPVRLSQLLVWLEDNDIDVIGLQETKVVDEKFPLAELQAAGYHVAFYGQRAYNGVAIASRYPLMDVVCNIPGLEDEQARVITVTINSPIGVIRLINAYFVNGQAPGTEKFAYKIRWLHALSNFIREEMAGYEKFLIMGDFNVAPDDCDTYDPEGLRGTIHHTVQEREHFQSLLGLGLVDAFRMFDRSAKSFSWWDYRMLGFQKNRGLRIDHILISQALIPHAVACSIDRAPRKNKQPSDHAPVFMLMA